MFTKILRFTVVFAMAAITVEAQWVKQTVNTSASLRGLSVVNSKIVWASGSGGTVVRTIDGGATWRVIPIPGGEKLDFRDIEAFDAETAFILSIGNGDASRIYKTTDGGTTWQLQFTNDDPKAFYDAIACWDKNNCLAMSDPVDGKYRLIATNDGGKTWPRAVPGNMPAANDGEAAFAASGTCLIVNGRNNVYLVTGGTNARVFRSFDRGSTWVVADTPMPKGTAGTGIFSIAFRNELHGTIVGGDFEKPNEAVSNLAFTGDGGKTWSAGEGLTGYRSSVAYVDDRTTIAVGTNGTDISFDRGGTWKKIGDESLNTVVAKGKKAVWAVGPGGAVLKLR